MLTNKYALASAGIILLLLLGPALLQAQNPAPTDDTLRKRIENDCPRLLDPAATDWEKVRILRTWTWSHVDMAWPPHLYDSRPDWHQLSAAQTIDLFDQDRGGVWCGGTATTLTRIYRLFNYQAFNINITMVPPATEWGSHALTLVLIPDAQGLPIWSLQDAYFNLCVADANAQPLDYVEFLKRLRQRRFDEVRLLKFDMPVQQWPAIIVPPPMRKDRTYPQVAHQYQMLDHDNFRPVELADGWLKLETPRTADQYEVRFYYFKEILAANGWPQDSTLAFLFAEQAFDGPADYRQAMQAVLGDLTLDPLPYPKYKVWFSTCAYREIPWIWARRTTQGRNARITVNKPGNYVLSIRAGEQRVPLDAICLATDENYQPGDTSSDDTNAIILEAEDFDEMVQRSNAFWMVLTRQSEHHSGRGFICSQPRGFELDWPDAPELRYRVHFPHAGQWYVWVRHNTIMPPDDLIHVGLDDQKIFSMALTE